MTKRIRIAIDLLSGDQKPRVRLAGIYQFHKNKNKEGNVCFELHGPRRLIERYLRNLGRRALLRRERYQSFLRCCRIVHVQRRVQMSQEPVAANRGRKGTSMFSAIQSVKERSADAVVSAGNTGALALMALSLGRIKKGLKPVLGAMVPTLDRPIFFLDLGAGNAVEIDAQSLHTNARLGAVAARCLFGLRVPRVGLVSNGEEEIKGTAVIREAANLLRIDSSGLFEYCGFVEPNRFPYGEVDVAVTDGFTGNMILKSMEGIATLFGGVFKREFSKSLTRKVRGLIARPVLMSARKQLNVDRFNGALFLGLTRPVIKSHGSTTPRGFGNAIEVAVQMVELDLVGKIASAFSTEIEKSAELQEA